MSVPFVIILYACVEIGHPVENGCLSSTTDEKWGAYECTLAIFTSYQGYFVGNLAVFYSKLVRDSKRAHHKIKVKKS